MEYIQKRLGLSDEDVMKLQASIIEKMERDRNTSKMDKDTISYKLKHDPEFRVEFYKYYKIYC